MTSEVMDSDERELQEGWMPKAFIVTHAVHKAYLKVTALVIGSFGPVFFLGTMAKTVEPARFTLDLLSWPVDGATTYEHPDTRFLSALTGGFLFGWGVMVWALSDRAFDLAPAAVRRAVLLGLGAWFVLDCAGSIASHNAANVAFNVVVLAVAGGPLFLPAPDRTFATRGLASSDIEGRGPQSAKEPRS